MNILGALKKAKSLSTVYFCEYDADEISWESVSRLLTLCPYSSRVEQTLIEEDYCDLKGLNEDMIRCVAIESVDRLNTDKRLVGVMFECDGKFISVAVPSYYDLDIYLCDLFPNSTQNTKSSTG